MAEPPLRRHDLLRIAPTSWAALVASPTARRHAPCLAAWAASGWPLVARRRLPADPPGTIAAGLPLPPAAGKARLAWSITPQGVQRIDPPLPLAEAVEAAPSAWRAMVHDLLSLGAAAAVVPQVFGSLAWTALTGLDFLGPDSDLDLLWRVGSGCALKPLLRSLGELDARSPMRLDGEIVWPDGRAVNWRELAEDRPEVLVKTIDGVYLAKTRDLLCAPVGS